MSKYYCLILYMLLINDVVLSQGQERKETVSFFEYSAEENYKRIGGADKNESPGPLITGVDALKLFESVIPGHREDPNSHRSVQVSGVCYILRKKDSTDKKTLPTSFGVGVFENREKAIVAFAQEVMMISGQIIPLKGLGDRAYYSTSPTNKSTNIIFRRKNVVLSLGIDLPRDAAIRIAKKMDNELELNTTFITKGEKITLPQIEIKNLPEDIGLNKTVEYDLELMNVNPEEALIDSSNSEIIIKPGKTPKIIYHSPKVEKEAGLKKIKIFVANQRNVLTTKEYTIKVLVKKN